MKRLFRAKLATLLLMLIPLAMGSDVPSASSPVLIPDTALAGAIRSALQKPYGDLTVSDLESLTVLDATEVGIEDLTGIEFATNLTDLDLSHNRIIDISPLAHLTRLDSLTLDGNLIHDLRPLVANEGLGRGDTLSLGYTCVDFDRDGPDMHDMRAILIRGALITRKGSHQGTYTCLHGPVRGWQGGAAHLEVRLVTRSGRKPRFSGELKPGGDFAIALHRLAGEDLTRAEGLMLHDQSDDCHADVTVSDPAVRLNTIVVITVSDALNSIGYLLRVNEPLETLPDPMISAAYVFATGELEINGTVNCDSVISSYRYDLQLEPGWQTILITADGFGTGTQQLTVESRRIPDDLVWTFMAD